MAAHYDISDLSSLIVDSANRVSLVADKSGNSAANCLCLNGVAGNSASVPDSVALSITGDIDIRKRVAPNDWTSGSSISLVAKWGSAGSRSFNFRFSAADRLVLETSADGTATSKTFTSSAAPGGTDLQPLWVRVTLDVDDGAGNALARFYTSPDGNTWTQLGTDVSSAGTTSIFDSAASVFLGSRDGTNDQFTGRIYRAQIYNGIGGTLVLDIDFSKTAKLATSFVCDTGQTVTINSSGDTGARICGERDLVQMTVAKQPRLLSHLGLNFAHLPGLSGAYLSTPDSAALDLTGDIQVIWRGRPRDLGLDRYFVSKYDTSANQRSWAFITDGVTANRLKLVTSPDGTSAASQNYTATADNPFTTTDTVWLKVWRKASDGGSSRVRFFYSLENVANPELVTWTQIGAEVTAATGNLFSSTANLEIGGRVNGTLGLMLQDCHYVDVRNTVDGTASSIVASFDSQRYLSGTTLVAASGETWALNGGATIVTRSCLYFDGSDDYLKAAAFALSQPETVYFVGQQVSWTINDGLWDGNTLDSMQLYQASTPPDLALYAGATAGTTSRLPILTYGLFVAVYHGTASSSRVNRAPSSVGNAGAANGGGFTLGAKATPSAPANLAASEVAIYGAAHGSQLRDRFALYAARKWRLSL
ncbi:MAG TPA: hypothetical protein VEB22_03685 [Phycisphaerales bacterium]|nr:hypothetical protein [Phycisphaerales bacterium]